MLSKKQEKYLADSSRAMESSGIAKALSRGEQVIAKSYDFVVSGGAVGDVLLGYEFPEAVIVTKIIAHEIDALTSDGSATVTVEAGSTALTGALAFDSAFTGTEELTLANVGGVPVALGEALQIAIGTAALTAGNVRFYVYAVPQRDI